MRIGTVSRSTAVVATVASLLFPGAASSDVPVAPMRLTLVARLDTPVNMAVRPGDGALYVVEKVGRIRAVRDGVVDPTPVLDISDQVSDGLEQGLLGLAFSPGDGAFMYVDYTDVAGDTHIVEYAFSDGRADPETRRELFFTDQPFANHNAGTLRFGPDGFLYIAVGDGGSGGDPQDNAQNLERVLGKLLRIDPRGAEPYAVPDSNPFVGVPGARAEIWAYGLRNPWQFSFDRQTGDLWIADVGQEQWEEIDFQPAGSSGGQNYGWNEMEGTHPYDGGTAPANHTPPIFEYPHPVGCSVTGGFVYRGARIPALQGVYVFGDWCAGRVWTLAELEGVRFAMETGLTVPLITAFGEDASGELYAMDLAGDLFRLDPLV